MPRWPVWSSETIESKALISNVIQPTHKIEEKIDQWLQNQPLQGEDSFTLHNWTIIAWYKWQNLLSIYRSLRGHKYNQIRHKNNNIRA